MPRAIIAPEEYYHIYNRGINKQDIFLTSNDYARALFSLLLFQANHPISNIGRQTTYFKKNLALADIEIDINDISQKRTVELCAFVLMPNHFHLIVKEVQENGIAMYLQRFEIAYTKYFNTLRERTGYLFQGPFQSIHIADNSQLLHLSAYIHRNPRDLKNWRGEEHKYPWSSFQDFIFENRWGNLLQCDVISDQLEGKEYKEFADSSGTKELDDDLLFDES